MLHCAFELRETIQSFQRRLLPFRDREAGYSVKEDRITDDDCDEVLKYLKLLVEFVDATKHLEATQRRRIMLGLEARFGKCFCGLVSWRIRLIKRSSPCRTSWRWSRPTSRSLKLRKEKLNYYWAIMMYDTPYYYAAVGLHPNLELAWFQKHCKKCTS